MDNGRFPRLRAWLAPPHPTWQSRKSRRRAARFAAQEAARAPRGVRVNIGSATQRFEVPMFSLDLFPADGVDVRGDIQALPFRDGSVDTVVCTGVLEHVRDPARAVRELWRIMKPGARLFVEVPFMQTVHASPDDYSRWTSDGLRRLLNGFDLATCEVVAGPATALAWQTQETLAMLFSLRSPWLYRVGLRVFGWLAVPLSWLDLFLERHPMASHAASGFAVVASKPVPSAGGGPSRAGS
jgi:SAM-dependent methyltransferase